MELNQHVSCERKAPCSTSPQSQYSVHQCDLSPRGKLRGGAIHSHSSEGSPACWEHTSWLQCLQNKNVLRRDYTLPDLQGQRKVDLITSLDGVVVVMGGGGGGGGGGGSRNLLVHPTQTSKRLAADLLQWGVCFLCFVTFIYLQGRHSTKQQFVCQPGRDRVNHSLNVCWQLTTSRQSQYKYRLNAASEMPTSKATYNEIRYR